MSSTNDLPRTAASGSPVTDRVAERSHETVDRVSATAARTEESLRSGAADAEAKLKDMGTQAQAKAEAQTGEIRRYVTEHPLTSAGIAFAAGFVLSGLMRR